MERLQEFALAFWSILAESGVYLIAGFFVAGLIHAFIPPVYLTKHLGGRGLRPVLKASLVGIPLPLCSCSVIPTAAALRRSGASKGASASFATTTPQIDVPAIALTWALAGPLLAIARPIVSLIAGVLAGVGIDATEPKPKPVGAAEPEPEAAGRTVSLGLSQPPPCCASKASSPAVKPASEPKPCCSGSSAGKSDEPGRFDRAMQYGFVTLPGDIARWLLIGLLLSAAIVVAIPEGWIERTLSSDVGHLAGLLVMLVVGLPWYVCATASTPLAAVFIAKGVSPGAALVFLLAGPATNAATMAWLSADLGKRALAIYLAAISVTAVASGWLLDTLLAQGVLPESWVRVADSVVGGMHTGTTAQVFGAIALVVLIAGLFNKAAASKRLA